jgi:ribosomal protein S19E (S16A)
MKKEDYNGGDIEQPEEALAQTYKIVVNKARRLKIEFAKQYIKTETPKRKPPILSATSLKRAKQILSQLAMAFIIGVVSLVTGIGANKLSQP